MQLTLACGDGFGLDRGKCHSGCGENRSMRDNGYLSIPDRDIVKLFVVCNPSSCSIGYLIKQSPL